MFDINWYLRLSSPENIPVLYPDHTNFEGQKLGFISGQIENPDLHYIGIDPAVLASRTLRFNELKKDLIASERNTTIKELYLDKLAEEFERIKLYQAVLDGQPDDFLAATSKVYGTPQPAIWHRIAQKLQKRRNYSLSKTPLLHQIITQYQPPQTIDEASRIRQPEASDILTLQKQLFSLFPFLALNDAPTELDATAIKDIFNEALTKIGALNWKSELIEGSRTAICVMNKNKVVAIPSKRRVNKATVAKLISHEICTHVYRSTQAEHSPLQLLRLGLDHYLMPEEGIATTNEQILAGEFINFSGETKYFAIGLVQGIDGIKRDFRTVYEIMKEYLFLRHPSKDQDYFNEKSWNLCVRIFRGTPANYKGVCYTKDLIYYEGNIKIWQLLLKDPQFYPYLFLGKYDPTKTQHLQALHDLGVLN